MRKNYTRPVRMRVGLSTHNMGDDDYEEVDDE